MKLNIHNKIYDLTDFSHPGGREILELCKNEPDCTALFESYHAFCDMGKIQTIMKQYEVGTSNIQSMFLFKPDGFYQTCKSRVKKLFTNRAKSKANYDWIKTVTSSSLLFLVCQYFMLFHQSAPAIIKIPFSILSGITLISLGYNVLHDGSHHGITQYPVINALSSKVIQSLLLLNHRLWSYHHCIRHHQYTGNIDMDPDMRNSTPFFRKSTKLEPKIQEVTTSWIGTKLGLFNCIFPGTMLGQSLLYHLKWVRKGWLWKMRLPDSFGNYEDIFQYMLSICFIWIEIYYAGLVYFLLHLIGTNIGFFIGSAPDHDMFVTHMEIEEDDKTLKDWGEIQVRHSANFCNSYSFFTKFYGGINYQIEHHLFPTLNNHYLKKISKIVKKCCEEFDIPYNHVDNPLLVYQQLVDTYRHIHMDDHRNNMIIPGIML